MTKGERYIGFKFNKSIKATKLKVVIGKHMKNYLKLELLDEKAKVIFSAVIPLNGEVILTQTKNKK